MDLNRHLIIGNLGDDPMHFNDPGKTEMTTFSVATTLRFQGANNQSAEETEWHRVVAFGKLADNCERLLSKGRQIYVEGRLRTRQYEAKDGSGTRYRTEIVALQLRVLGNRLNSAVPNTETSDDIRF